MRLAALVGDVEVEERLRTALPHVYAIGNAIDGMMFTHVSTYEAPIAIANMLDGATLTPGLPDDAAHHLHEPRARRRGIEREEQARAVGQEVQVRRYDVGKLGKASALGDRRGRVKFVLEARTGAILGVHVLSQHAGDLLPGLMVAMNAPGRTLAPLLATTHSHPTLSEGVKVAARDG